MKLLFGETIKLQKNIHNGEGKKFYFKVDSSAKCVYGENAKDFVLKTVLKEEQKRNLDCCSESCLYIIT